MVADINAKYCPSSGIADRHRNGQKIVIDYEECVGMSLEERLGVWLSGDVCITTAIKEGLNMHPLEYIYCRKDLPHAGAVVVSEFSTCSSLLNGSMKVNPFNPQFVADVLSKALSMSEKEANTRRLRDLDFISTHPSSYWSKTIVNELTSRQQSKPGRVQAAVTFSRPIPIVMEALMRCYDESVRVAGLSAIGERVFIIDYVGMLLQRKDDVYIVHASSSVSGKHPSNAVLDALKRLSDDPRNVVMVLTGLPKVKVNSVFKGLDNVTLVTSDGLVYSWGTNLRGNSAIKAKNGFRTTSNNTTTATGLAAGSSSLVPNIVSGSSTSSIPKPSSIAIPSATGLRSESGKDSPVVDIYRRSANAECYYSSSSDDDVMDSDEDDGQSDNSDNNSLKFKSAATGIASNATSSSSPSEDSKLAASDRRGTLQRAKSSYHVFATADSKLSYNDGRDWQFLDCSIDWQAVSEIALPIITRFTFRTNGSSVNAHIPGIGFNYIGADPEWGRLQAAQLQVEDFVVCVR
jgi:hypothetical protein